MKRTLIVLLLALAILVSACDKREVQELAVSDSTTLERYVTSPVVWTPCHLAGNSAVCR